MRTLKFIVDGQRLKKDPQCDFSGLVVGSKNYLECEFAFSKDWVNMAKAATFKSGVFTEHVPIINNLCKIPDSITDSTRIHLTITGRDTRTILTTNTSIIIQRKGV